MTLLRNQGNWVQPNEGTREADGSQSLMPLRIIGCVRDMYRQTYTTHCRSIRTLICTCRILPNRALDTRDSDSTSRWHPIAETASARSVLSVIHVRSHVARGGSASHTRCPGQLLQTCKSAKDSSKPVCKTTRTVPENRLNHAGGTKELETSSCHPNFTRALDLRSR